MTMEKMNERAERMIAVWVKDNERLVEDLARIDIGRVRMVCAHEKETRR